MPNPPGAAEKVEDARLFVCCYELGKVPNDLFGKKEESNKQSGSGEETKKKDDDKKPGRTESKVMEGEQFIERDHGPPPSTPLFNPGDGFDVYIDAARLPDNTTIPKVVARVMTHDLEFVAMSNLKESRDSCV